MSPAVAADLEEARQCRFDFKAFEADYLWGFISFVSVLTGTSFYRRGQTPLLSICQCSYENIMV